MKLLPVMSLEVCILGVSKFLKVAVLWCREYEPGFPYGRSGFDSR